MFFTSNKSDVKTALFLFTVLPFMVLCFFESTTKRRKRWQQTHIVDFGVCERNVDGVFCYIEKVALHFLLFGFYLFRLLFLYLSILLLSIVICILILLGSFVLGNFV